MSDSCLRSCVETTFKILTAPQGIADKMSNLYTQISNSVEEGEMCNGHLVWAWPTNALLNIIQIALSPLVALVSLIAAAIFGAFSCCSEDCQITAKCFFVLSMAALSDHLVTAIVRVASPSFKDPETCTQALGQCLGLIPRLRVEETEGNVCKQ
jgi:hypothetical protein